MQQATGGGAGVDRNHMATMMQALSPEEVHRLLDLLDGLTGPDAKGYRDLDILGLVGGGRHGSVFSTLALRINQVGRQLDRAGSAVARAPAIRELAALREQLTSLPALATPAGADRLEEKKKYQGIEDAIVKIYESTVWRTPLPEEIGIWLRNFSNGLPFHEFVLLMSNSPEATGAANGIPVLQDISNGEYIQLAHEHTQGRGAGGAEVQHWLVKIERGELTRSEILSRLFVSGASLAAQRENSEPHDGLSCRIMGTHHDLTAAEWERQAMEISQNTAAPAAGQDEHRYRHRFTVTREPRVLVSALTSLYRGGDFIEQFMDNICSQDGFDDYCELVIVDADSPENEAETIRRYTRRHKNINYIRLDYTIGIYDAWNVAAKAARGEYLTNANLDDLRRRDSFMLQAGTLDNLPFVDVVYQDLYYTFDSSLSFDEIARFGHKTVLPVLTLHNLVEYNSPHNAPMWRRSLHDDVGWFDTHFRSAGDYDFWFRCLQAGKTFYKINDPHVVYYQNPKGLSTRPDSRGLLEAMEVHKRYCRKLMPEEVVMPTDELVRKIDPDRVGLLDRMGTYRYAIVQEALRDIARTRKFSRLA